MTNIEAEKKYRDMGMVTHSVEDQPGEYYEAHRHGEVYLFTLAGRADLRLDDGEW